MLCIVHFETIDSYVGLKVEAGLTKLLEIGSGIRLGSQLIHILLISRLPEMRKHRHTIATRARRRVDQIDIESAILASGSACLECIERAAKTDYQHEEYRRNVSGDLQCSAASLCTPIFRPVRSAWHSAWTKDRISEEAIWLLHRDEWQAALILYSSQLQIGRDQERR